VVEEERMKRLNRDDVLAALIVSTLIMVVMEMMCWAITGDYILFRGL
jgi:hypothetical protein